MDEETELALRRAASLIRCGRAGHALWELERLLGEAQGGSPAWNARCDVQAGFRSRRDLAELRTAGERLKGVEASAAA
jgi:hypothetical protein